MSGQEGYPTADDYKAVDEALNTMIGAVSTVAMRMRKATENEREPSLEEFGAASLFLDTVTNDRRNLRYEEGEIRKAVAEMACDYRDARAREERAHEEGGGS